VRWDNWKVTFMEQRCEGTLQIWGEPFVKLRLPKLYNLRTDPYERADKTSNTYHEWHIQHGYVMYPILTGVGKFVETFKEFPPAQHADSFTPTEALAKLQAAGGGG
jgi:arylsulfatase